MPLLESLPPPDAGARKYEVAHAGDASRTNRIVSANFFISTTNLPKTAEETQGDVAHHHSILILLRDQVLLVDRTGKGQVRKLFHFEALTGSGCPRRPPSQS